MILLWSGTLMRSESLGFGPQRLESLQPAPDGCGAGCLSLPRLFEHRSRPGDPGGGPRHRGWSDPSSRGPPLVYLRGVGLQLFHLTAKLGDHPLAELVGSPLPAQIHFQRIPVLDDLCQPIVERSRSARGLAQLFAELLDAELELGALKRCIRLAGNSCAL